MNGLKDYIRGLQSALKEPFDKRAVAEAVAKEFGLTLERSVYFNDDFAIRFSSSKNESFSNVVLSLSALAKYDRKPFIVCVVRPDQCELLLANSTFLKKISHSSHQLRMDNVRGSFLGHDIMREYEGISNELKNFGELFALHAEFSWDENLARLVDATTRIAPTGVRFAPSDDQVEKLLSSVELAISFCGSKRWRENEKMLQGILAKKQAEILDAAENLNVNLRGNSIEQIITGGENVHHIGNFIGEEDSGPRLLIDIKSKLLTRHSAPKAYNIDKFLSALADGNTVIGFFLVGVNPEKETVAGKLVSVFDDVILGSTRIQFHWAGRNSRGVTQLVGNYGEALLPSFRSSINKEKSKAFLTKLLGIGEKG